MKPNKRHQKIIELLLQDGQISVNRLVDLLQVSEGTVRTDLRKLEREEKLIRTRGGAAVGKLRGSRTTEAGNGSSASPTENFSSIQRIAQRAATLVNEGDTILLDGSSITAAMVD